MMKLIALLLTSFTFLACSPSADSHSNAEPETSAQTADDAYKKEVVAESQTNNFKNISGDELEQLLESQGGTLLDVRTADEVAGGVIGQPLHLDFYGEGFGEQLKSLDMDKTKPVYVYCASGRRSSNTAKMLIENGYGEVYNLSGGFNQWSQEGRKTEKLK
jgi:rhodanese-related sulfurtransferase